jgi:transposase
MIVKNITVFFTINAMILESTVTTFFRYECNGEDCSFTHKRPSHRVFRKKVKGNGKNVYL